VFSACSIVSTRYSVTAGLAANALLNLRHIAACRTGVSFWSYRSHPDAEPFARTIAGTLTSYTATQSTRCTSLTSVLGTSRHLVAVRDLVAIRALTTWASGPPGRFTSSRSHLPARLMRTRSARRTRDRLLIIARHPCRPTGSPRMHPMRQLPVAPTCRMQTRLPRRANHKHLFGHPAASARGAFRDRHERWLWDAMDATSRQTIVEVTYGEVVWFWRPDAGAKFPERATRALGMTGARKPGPREEHEGHR
jgi:predicted Fe-S protein YdhL (DUF1289 family)